jgi:hypothetical protein
MAKDWKQIKAEIEAEIDKIWFEEPEEVTMSKMGVYPGNAGTDGQYFTNLFFLVCDTQAMSWWSNSPAMSCMLNDDSFTLDHCKKAFVYMNHEMARLMGDQYGEACPAPWLNQPKMWRWTLEIEAAYDTIKTKQEFKSLLWSWFNYVERIHRWFYNVFPWELGYHMKKNNKEYLEKLQSFQK